MIDNKTIRKVIMLNKMLPSGSPTYENREASGAVANFETNTVQPFVSLNCDILPIQEGTGTPSPSNPRPISGTSVLDIYHSGADTSDYDTTSVALGQTVYGGSAEVVGGVGEKTHELVTFDGSESVVNVTYNSGSGLYYTSVINNVPTPNYSQLLSDKFKGQAGVAVGNCYTVNGTIIAVLPDQTADTIEKATQWFIDNPTQFVYPLATPTDFTFTGQPINSLLGVNNVWTDSGDTKVTYKYKTGEGGYSNKKYIPIFYDFYGKGCRHL